MGLTLMTTNDDIDHDHDDPNYIRARAFVCLQTLDTCRARLTAQASASQADYKEKLTAVTQEYRAILRDGVGESEKAKAKAFDKISGLLADRDKIEEQKTRDRNDRKAKLEQVNEADAEAKSYKPKDHAQLTLLSDPAAVKGMPWATDKALGVIYTALRDLEQSGAQLGPYQEALMAELAEASIEGADLGLEAKSALEADGETAAFEDEEAELDEVLEQVENDLF